MFIQRWTEHFLHNDAYIFFAPVKSASMRWSSRGEAGRRDAFNSCFHGSRHGAGINNVDTVISSVINAAEAKVWFSGEALCQQPVLQSTGVPLHPHVSTLSAVCILWSRSGWPIVMAWPIPDCGRSGATIWSFQDLLLPPGSDTRCRHTIIIRNKNNGLLFLTLEKIFFADVDFSEDWFLHCLAWGKNPFLPVCPKDRQKFDIQIKLVFCD